MATDLEKLVVQLSADVKGFEREMLKAVGVSNKQARAIENRYKQMNRNLDGIGRRAANSIIAPLSGVAAALSVREIGRYADAWTVAQNKINAASQIAGMQGRSLEDLNKIADNTRSGISETVDLYAKLLRSTAGVAKSEMEVARATEVVNKAFKAGGAAASEQVAGILQLSQGLGSGVLQGDELRSVRENAPILAQALADYYKVNIAGLKKLGEEGRITSDGVFKAILAAQPKIEAAFATTNATIQDGVTRVNNAFTQYIGQTDSSLSASQRLVAGLSSLADNFETVADVTLKVAAIFAAGLLGRSIAGMASSLGLGAAALARFVIAARTATSITGLSSAMMGLSAAAGPIGILLGVTAATAMVVYADNTREASERTARLKAEVEALGLYAPKAAEAVDAVTVSIDKLTEDKRIAKVRDLRDELSRLRGEDWGAILPLGGDNFRKVREEANVGQRGAGGYQPGDQAALQLIEQMAVALMQGKLEGDALIQRFAQIEAMDLSAPATALLERLRDMSSLAGSLDTVLTAAGGSEAMEKASAQLADLQSRLEMMRGSGQWDAEIIAGIERIIDGFEDGEISAEDAKRAITDVGSANPDFAGIIGRLGNVIGWLATLRSEAVQAKAAIAAISPGSYVSSGRGEAVGQYWSDRRKTEDFVAEQGRLNGLSKERQDIERRTTSILKAAGEEGAKITAEQAQQLAIQQAAADARRSQEGKSSGGGGGSARAVERFDDRIMKEIEGLKAETVEIDRLGVSYDRYGMATERARREAELLQDLQNKGVPITEQLKQSVRGLTENWLAAAEANAQAQRKYDDFQAAVEDYRGTMESAFTGLVTGAHSFRDALGMVVSKLAEMAASRAFEQIWDGPSGKGGIGGGVGSFLKGLLGFSGGGYTGPGGVHQPAGVVHKGEVVWSQRDVARVGGPAAADAIRRGVAGYAQGGVVGVAPVMPSLAKPSSLTADTSRPVDITVNVEGANGDQHLISLVQTGVAAGLSNYDRALPDRISQINKSPRRR